MNFISCEKCELADYRIKNNYKMVWGDGSTSAKIFVIGEAPGEKEAEIGKPFMGRSGKLLRGILSEYFNLEQDIFITNTINCRPPENRAPNIEEQNKCYPFIYSQIFTIKPKIIFTAGKVSSDWFGRIVKKNYKIYEGQVVDLLYSNILWVPVYHPSYLLRCRNKIVDFKNCLTKYQKVISETCRRNI